jgi:hypothetical protein
VFDLQAVDGFLQLHYPTFLLPVLHGQIFHVLLLVVEVVLSVGQLRDDLLRLTGLLRKCLVLSSQILHLPLFLAQSSCVTLLCLPAAGLNGLTPLALGSLQLLLEPGVILLEPRILLLQVLVVLQGYSLECLLELREVFRPFEVCVKCGDVLCKLR